jgi:hypothetical protein
MKHTWLGNLRKLGSITVLPVCLSLPGCDNTQSTPDSLVPMEIVVPKLTDTLPSVQHGFIVAKYDASKVGLLTWYYSKDEMLTWQNMSIMDSHTLSSEERGTISCEDPYAYDVRRWWPSLDTLSDTTIYIKLAAYGGLPFIIKGPIAIR